MTGATRRCEQSVQYNRRWRGRASGRSRQNPAPAFPRCASTNRSHVCQAKSEGEERAKRRRGVEQPRAPRRDPRRQRRLHPAHRSFDGPPALFRVDAGDGAKRQLGFRVQRRVGHLEIGHGLHVRAKTGIRPRLPETHRVAVVRIRRDEARHRSRQRRSRPARRRVGRLVRVRRVRRVHRRTFSVGASRRSSVSPSRSSSMGTASTTR